MLSTKSGISIQPTGIADILLRWQLTVPLNQRPYKWEDDEVEKLFQDLTKAVNDNRPVYFCGTVMFTEGTKGSTEVADGQQRLATISILIAAVRDYLIELGDAAGAAQYQTDFLIKYDPPSGLYRPRLSLNVQDNEFFHQSVLLPPDKRPSIQHNLHTSNERIKSAADVAKQHVRNITGGLSNSDKMARLYTWLTFLKDSALVIVVTVPPTLGNSFKMFETLNARGMPATQVDIIKNFLFEKAPEHTQRVNSHWISMLTTIESYGNDSLVLKYIHHLWISIHGPTTVDNLGTEIEAKIKNESDSLIFVELLERAAVDYIAMLTPLQSSRWEGLSSKARQSLNIISNEFAGEQIRPLMLAVTRKFEIPEMERAFRQFLSWSVRFLIVGGAGGGKLERYYGVRAKDVTNGTITSASRLAEDMSDVLPNDRQFQEEFSKAAVRKSNLARYYLRAIEAFLAADPDPMLLINEDPNAVNLEHVMPVTPSGEWEHFDADTLAVYHKRLGNMVLLSSKTNVKLGNSGFENKRKILAKVLLKTTNEVAKCEVWGPDQIRERQTRFAELAPKIWPLTWK